MYGTGSCFRAADAQHAVAIRRAGCAATRQTCCGLLVASHIQPARQSSDVAPHRVPQRSRVGRRRAEKPRPDVIDGIGALHVLAPNHLNLIVELFSSEQHAKLTRSSLREAARSFREGNRRHCSSGRGRECGASVLPGPRGFAAGLQILESSVLRSPLRLDEPDQPQLVKHLSVSYDGSARHHPYLRGCRRPVGICFERQHVVRIPRLAIEHHELSCRRAPHRNFSQHLENAVGICEGESRMSTSSVHGGLHRKRGTTSPFTRCIRDFPQGFARFSPIADRRRIIAANRRFWSRPDKGGQCVAFRLT